MVTNPLRHLIAVAVCLAPATPAAAQVELAPHQVVRVTLDSSSMLGAPRARFSGTVSELTADSLTMRLSNGASLTVPRDRLARLEISNGTRSQVVEGALKGVLIGASVGAVVGIVTLASSDENSFCCQYGPEVIPAAAVGGAFWGLLIGTIAGALSKETKWEDVGRLKPSAAGIGLAIEF